MTERMIADEDDWALLLKAGMAGDHRAYVTFLRKVTPVVRRIVHTRGRHFGDATCEDIVQDVLLAVHLKRHTWDDQASVRPWVYAITRYKVVDAFRARGRRLDLSINDFTDDLAAEPGPDPMQASDMLKMISMLDVRSAQVVRRIGIDGYSVAETGQDLMMTEGAVRVALHRAFKRLASLRERHLE